MELIRARRIAVAEIVRDYDLSERQALRDLQELRRLGATMGFRIGKRTRAGYVELAEFSARPAALVAGERNLRTLMAEIFKAFGEPLHGFAEGLGDADGSSFVRVVMPRLVAGSDVAAVLEKLRAAWSDGARVRFRYGGKEREVEPAAALVRSGRYYLLGRQIAPSVAWRIFSMDEISGGIVRCGSFTPKPPPPEYSSTDAIGWIKTGASHPVEVTVSPRLAATAASRTWQQAQTTRLNEDGTVTLGFDVGDVDEVVRWALGYGDDAWVSAPPSAVERAKHVLEGIVARYR